MDIYKYILVTSDVIKVQEAIWMRPQGNGGMSIYMPHGTTWQKIVQLGDPDDGDDDPFDVKEIYEGDEPPKNLKKLWLDPETNELEDLDPETSTTVQLIWAAIHELQRKSNTLYKLYQLGVISGDSTISPREDMMAAADPIKPDNVDTEDTDEEIKPDTEEISYTVPAICIKCDTASNFSKNRQNLSEGEILFYTDLHKIMVYYQGRFWGASSSEGGGGGGGGITIEDLYALVLDYLKFGDGNDNIYKLTVNTKGELKAGLYSDLITRPGSKVTNDVYVSHLLSINTIYCGGQGGENCLVSHNFVELANGDTKDINLNGLFLLYTDGTQRDPSDIGFIWHVLPLKGIIRAGETFLIRGAQCNDVKSSLIRVEDYDMEWWDGEDLISFNQGCASFYLCAGDVAENWVYDSNGDLMGRYSLRSPWNKNSTNVGYIDSCGFGVNSVGEGNAAFLVDDDWNKVMFVRWFMLEPAKQGNKAYASRTTVGLWTYINLEKQNEALGNSKQYYYPDWMKIQFSPRAAAYRKDFFTNKRIFDDKHPNMVNLTFGIQATADASNNILASRCLNWVSVGYYDEYVEYRKRGTTVWNRVYSISENDVNNPSDVVELMQFYGRYRWCSSNGTWVTTHKALLRHLFDAGVWEYRVGRDDDEDYKSPISTFTVVDNSEIAAGFNFIQTTDQQGFNWAEYQAWKRTADCIKDNEQNVLFTINTGDITQSGNRENEWLDYYDGRKAIRELEEMFTIGNNDLCGHDATKLTDGNDATSKYNHINVLRYFTFELNPENTHVFTWNGEQYPLYSLYSFNFGSWHFVCLNSETAKASSKTYVDYDNDSYPGDETFAKTANAAIEDWFKKDLQIFKNISGATEPTDCSNVIAYMHEMPFTMVTWDFMSGSSARAGSHLNTLDNNGNYRFSRLFKKYGIRLVIGGHKHTYTISKPIYDAPAGYIDNENHVNPGVDLMGEVTGALSRTPVIQVLREEDVLANMSQYARYEVVESINAPVYVMSQASGYKLVSNKEQPSGDQYTIPWLLAYFKPKTNASSPTENRRQHYPMYVRYEVKPDSIKIIAKQVHGIWNVNEQANTASYDMNNQLVSVVPDAMTLHETSAADRDAYGILDIDSYTVEL